MEDQIKKIIVSRLKDKDIEVVHDRTIHEVDFMRLFFTEVKPEKQLHVFTLIPNTIRAKLSWYEGSHYDDSMDAMAKCKVREEHPIDQAITEYFLQGFEIAGQEWLLRWS